MDKSLVTNLLALLLSLVGLLVPGGAGEVLRSTGLFALSGAFTNWVAVHMLFEKVPGLYGSGVVPLRFEEFKRAIRDLVMQQFFSPEHVEAFFQRLTEGGEGRDPHGLRPLVEKLDLDQAFDALLDVIMASSFGGMLGMFGGRPALEPLREPFQSKMKDFLLKVGEDPEVVAQLKRASVGLLLDKVGDIVDRRLEELTPQLVKQIVQRMIREHLGWLVVWGGVLGGLIGLLSALLLL